MWKILGNIFSSIDVKDIIARTDDWNLTKEETIKYQLEWLRTIPTGFQLAQRLIGVAFSFVFLFLIIITFFMLLFGKEIELLIAFIEGTMVTPIMIIFSLFFGGGLMDSYKRKPLNPEQYAKPKVTTEERIKAPEAISEPIEIDNKKPLSRGQRRRQNKREAKRRELN